MCAPYNNRPYRLGIFVPKIIKFGGNLTKLCQNNFDCFRRGVARVIPRQLGKRNAFIHPTDSEKRVMARATWGNYLTFAPSFPVQSRELKLCSNTSPLRDSSGKISAPQFS